MFDITLQANEIIPAWLFITFICVVCAIRLYIMQKRLSNEEKDNVALGVVLIICAIVVTMTLDLIGSINGGMPIESKSYREERVITGYTSKSVFIDDKEIKLNWNNVDIHDGDRDYVVTNVTVKVIEWYGVMIEIPHTRYDIYLTG